MPADPTRYGRSFADVYDDWYPGGDEDAVVATVARHVRPAGRILELGVGTGRVALPLTDAGLTVTGMDVSAEMLARLAAKDPDDRVSRVLADDGDPTGWPAGPFRCVLAACNLLLNLASADAQQRCVSGAAAALDHGGVLVVELAHLAPPDGDHRQMEVKSVEADRVVLIATDTDPATGVVQGNHIELRQGEPVVLRPWSIRMLALGELDCWCAAAGLDLVERHADWTGSPATGDDPVTVSVFRRP